MDQKEKNRRKTALSSFTRNGNSLQHMIDNASPDNVVTPQFEKFQSCWNKLEDAHESFMESMVGDIADDDPEMKYLDAPTVRYNELVVMYSAYAKTSAQVARAELHQTEIANRKAEEEIRKEAEETLRKDEVKVKFESAKAELTTSISAFKRLAASKKDSLIAASDSVNRHELEKLETDFSLLKQQLVKFTGVDPNEDTTDMDEMFVTDVETVYVDTRKLIVDKLKDSSSTSRGDSAALSSSTKKEAVKLPFFKGAEDASPYLNYPTWRSRWDTHIISYEATFRFGMLWDHIDDAAREKIVGHKDNHDIAMDKLHKYFGDTLKVVDCVMEDALSPLPVSEGDYKGLINYADILVNNYERLKDINLEHEMSNTSVMSVIVKKFPRLVSEKWHEHLLTKTSLERVKSFPIFISWLSTQKEMWQCMVSADYMKSHETFYSSLEDSAGGVKTCYVCGESGHVRRNCPKKNLTKGGGQSGSRNKPKVKKFWCALHKGDKSRKCFSSSCMELRKMTDVQKRIDLLKENGDCIHCTGDHLPADCNKVDRVCGGGRSDRGCSKSHKVNELFCKDAKVFMANNTGNVVLCIMKVRAPKGYIASVFWDSGATSNFIREAFAKLCGFKGRKETLSVTTLGGVVTEYLVVTAYTCFLMDEDGVMVSFKAYGLECITGSVSRIPSSKLQKLFPNVSRKLISCLERESRVDVLLGLSHPSWHPERAEKAAGGGDLWIYRGRFGACVGGRHSEVEEGTRRSKDLFTVNVNHTYFIQATTITEEVSHDLEYCPARAASQYESSRKLLRGPVPRRSPSVDVFASDATIIPLECISEAVDLRDRIAEDGPLDSVDETVPLDCPVAVVSLDHVAEPVVPLVVPEAVSFDHNLEPVVPSCHVGDCNVSLDSTLAARTHVALHSLVSNSCLDPTAPVWIQPGNGRCESGEEVRSVHSATCAAVQAGPLTTEQFFQLEALGTIVEPACGGCKCSKCPVPGSVYSFKEQREYDIVNAGLTYCKESKRWFAELPWKTSRSALARNDNAALKGLLSVEKLLKKKPELAAEFCQQVQAMVERGAAVLLSKEERDSWKGDYHYLPMVGATNKKGLRVCFDASRKQCGRESMNHFLYKGPDRFMNDLLSVLLCFRDGRVGCAADIIKFHNQVHLVKEDQHMQRFKWRNMETDKEPEDYLVPVNNFGVCSANCIATCALHRSADEFKALYPVESEEIKKQTYIDDQLAAAPDKEQALIKTRRWDEITDHASMHNKGWTFSGDKGSNIPLGDASVVDKVLGQLWDPEADVFLFQASLRVSLGGRSEVINITTVEELAEFRDAIMNRRILLSNIQSIFDPLGLLTPILLQAKLLMRETWSGPDVVGWDDLLPDSQSEGWMTFLTALLNLGELRFPRSLWPEEEVVGLPILIIFTDGSTLAFGTAAYIRWELKTGGFWVRLIMAKSKIAPKNMLSVPRMELNGLVLGNRIKNYILKNSNMKFLKVYQLVDSSTVLGYIHKECGTFNPYEGIRVSEVQSDPTNIFVDGHCQGFAWIAGTDNPADWCTKPRSVNDLLPGGFWQGGSKFLLLKESEWPIKLSYRTDRLEGEINLRKQCHVAVVNVAHPDFLGRIVRQFSSWKKMYRVLAWILRLGCPSGPLEAEEIRRAKLLLIKYAQKDIETELKLSDTGKGRYRRLAPTLDDDGLWRVGSRIRHYVPFTLDRKLPVLLPTDHAVTLLIMRSAHCHSHVAHDGTLCRFRLEGYWAVRAGSLAKRVASACVTCRKMSNRTLAQPLGEIPADQMKEPVAWGHCQMDLVGPVSCRSDVNLRTRKKTWGLVIEDVNSGAVHLDVVSDYSTNAVLMSLRRFGSLRGWPGTIQSDPGSQLESASGKLENWYVLW